MKVIADFHIHSRFSRATSREINVINLAKWAKLKGIGVLGTGDFTHPQWFNELKSNLRPAEPGLYRLKGADSETRFILTTEISCIYSKNNRVRKIHLMVMAPSLEEAEKINARLEYVGNLRSDGRPILGLDAKELLKIVLQLSPASVVVPCHAWTPWFSIFGSKSGFNSVEECFEEYSKYIFALETGLSCYDKETEVLTEDGWKKFNQVVATDKMCTLNLISNEIEYQKPQEIYRSKYHGKMYSLKTKRADLLVTPNHNLVYAPADFRTKRPFRIKEAEYLFGKSKMLKKDGIWRGQNQNFFILPEVKMRHGSRYYSGIRIKKARRLEMRSWLKFFGFWIAEGWVTMGGNGDYDVCIAANKTSARQEMVHILKRFGYHPYSDEKIVRVRNYQLYSYLKQFSNGAAYKFIPKDIKTLSRELLEILLKFYLKGDGHIYGRNGKGRSATTISTRLRDDLQEIALKVGDSAYYKLHNKKGTPLIFPDQKKQYYQSADSWVIYFIKHNRHSIIPSVMKKHNYKEEWVDYDGTVYCVSVPNRTLYIRRNGIPLWCGNSDPKMNWRLSALDKYTLVSNSDAHSLKKLGREANVFEGTDFSYQEIVAALKKSSSKLKLIYTIEFFPEEGKYHYDGHRNCNVVFSPEETKKHNGLCPVCKRPLTVGVLNRVDELADQPEGKMHSQAIPFKCLVPLQEIIAEALGVTSLSKKVDEQYNSLISRLGSEFHILLEATEAELQAIAPPLISQAILRVRKGKVLREPGYDGVFGKIKTLSQEEKQLSSQKTLFQT